ncbi:hypothetical protein [Lysobacter sp. CA196]|uniref:hypothetical protein n=1 Tax=Lysobacter sp. CA196 TaxID=3455606 RepID=UPI003F8D4566
MSERTSALCRCGCADARGAAAHAIVAALAQDDLDAAIALGLLNANFDDRDIDGIVCRQCTDACMQALRSAREARLRALAARERYRARNQRLQRRADERAARRAATPAPTNSADTSADNTIADTSSPTTQRPALPSAAAAALARAKAKAAQRGPT